jgi:uncharacterized protein YbjT (DUF2867 family)
MNVFVAGDSGAAGRRMIPQLVAAGHSVVAAMRCPSWRDGCAASLNAKR